MAKKVSRQVIISRLEKQVKKQKDEIKFLNSTIDFLRNSQSAAKIQEYEERFSQLLESNRKLRSELARNKDPFFALTNLAASAILKDITGDEQ